MASIKVLLYTSKLLKNGEHPIMVRLTKDRKTKYISMGHSCMPDLWDHKKNLPKRKHPNFRELEINIELKKTEAKSLLLGFENEQKDFSLDDFKQRYRAQTARTSVYEYIDKLTAELNKTGRIGYANSHKDLKRILTRFREQEFYFSDVDHAFLRRLEQFFRERDMNENAMGVYFRTLRAVYNKAIADGYIKKGDTPFDDFKVSKFKSQTRKRAISKEDIQQLAKVDVAPSLRLYDSRNAFLFSFYCSGINFIDVAHLKWTNIINGETLNYEREKTGDVFTLKILPPALAILDHYRSFRTSGYIFPYLDASVYKTPASIHQRIQERRKVTNKDLKKLALMAGIDPILTTYTARHSFATVLKRSGVATGKIAELMGHESERTTQVYLDSFEQEDLHDAMLNLL